MLELGPELRFPDFQFHTITRPPNYTVEATPFLKRG